MNDKRRIGIIGGTGQLGAALGGRLAKAGYPILLGSRSAESAQKTAITMAGVHPVQGMSNADAAAAADLIIVTVPFAAQEATLLEIAPHVKGKIVVDTTVPLVPPKVMRVQLPAEGSAAARAQRLVGEGVTVVSAFHNVAAHALAEDEPVDCDVLVFGEDRSAREVVVQLVTDIGLRGLHGGALPNSAAAEALTSILIFMNKTYGFDGAGIRITGTPRNATPA